MNQIDDMAHIIKNTWLPIMCGDTTVGEVRIGDRDAYRIANSLADGGYSKTKEGFWTNYSTTMMQCSECDRHIPYHRYEYCPHCGSKNRRAD